ncbi:uncharacterized protein LOC143652727 [Tamandua tetradactyla]|uniref:uncharacterized protein LOC143652727 n=1 Tax=Tamandua tetradactyla TaxID=48850 RepID=UPI0040541B47
MEARGQCHNILKVLNEKGFQSRILYPSKPSFKIECNCTGPLTSLLLHSRPPPGAIPEGGEGRRLRRVRPGEGHPKAAGQQQRAPPPRGPRAGSARPAPRGCLGNRLPASGDLGWGGGRRESEGRGGRGSGSRGGKREPISRGRGPPGRPLRAPGGTAGRFRPRGVFRPSSRFSPRPAFARTLGADWKRRVVGMAAGPSLAVAAAAPGVLALESSACRGLDAPSLAALDTERNGSVRSQGGPGRGRAWIPRGRLPGRRLQSPDARGRV